MFEKGLNDWMKKWMKREINKWWKERLNELRPWITQRMPEYDNIHFALCMDVS